MSISNPPDSLELIPHDTLTLDGLQTVLQLHGWECRVKHGNGGFLAVTLETGELAIDHVPVLHVLTISTAIDLPEGPLSKETLRLLAYLNGESMGPRYYVDYCWDKPIAVVSLEVRTYPVLVMDHMLEGLKQVAREIRFHGCQYHSTRHLRP